MVSRGMRFLLLGVVASFLTFAYAAIFLLPDYFVNRDARSSDPKVMTQAEAAKARNDVRTSLLQGAGGLLLLLGAGLTLWQLQLSREGQITERFTRAIDHLGDPATDLRIGGVYALERIAQNSPADR